MPKISSSLVRFLLELVLCVLCVTVMYFALSSYFFVDIFTSSANNSLSESLRQEDRLLQKYREGSLGLEELKAAVNPSLNDGGSFYMLLDGEQNVLAYTENAAPYFAGNTLDTLLKELRSGSSATLRTSIADTAVLLAGQRTDNGVMLAGRPLRAFNGAAVSFRNRLLLSMLLITALILTVGSLAASRTTRSVRIITQMAGRINEGEQVTLRENMPGNQER